jgi:aspartate-semialdehyde dehydrogenase
VAGQSGITVSDVAHDRGNPRSLWIWAASDNLRGIAENAILAAGMLARKDVR